jgi:hypothetical protein
MKEREEGPVEDLFVERLLGEMNLVFGKDQILDSGIK